MGPGAWPCLTAPRGVRSTGNPRPAGVSTPRRSNTGDSFKSRRANGPRTERADRTVRAGKGPESQGFWPATSDKMRCGNRAFRVPCPHFLTATVHPWRLGCQAEARLVACGGASPNLPGSSPLACPRAASTRTCQSGSRLGPSTVARSGPSGPTGLGRGCHPSPGPRLFRRGVVKARSAGRHAASPPGRRRCRLAHTDGPAVPPAAHLAHLAREGLQGAQQQPDGGGVGLHLANVDTARNTNSPAPSKVGPGCSVLTGPRQRSPLYITTGRAVYLTPARPASSLRAAEGSAPPTRGPAHGRRR
jgi:hypothetical protein